MSENSNSLIERKISTHEGVIVGNTLVIFFKVAVQDFRCYYPIGRISEGGIFPYAYILLISAWPADVAL